MALLLLSLELPFPPHSLPNNHLKTGSGGAILKCRGGTFCIGYFCQFVYLSEVTTSGRHVSCITFVLDILQVLIWWYCPVVEEAMVAGFQHQKGEGIEEKECSRDFLGSEDF